MRKRRIMFLIAAVIVVALLIVGCALSSKPSPVGAWSMADSQDWIEFTNQKEEDLFMPQHDGSWTRHHGENTSSGKWLRVAGDRRSFDMIEHVSGPMYVKDGRMTLDGNDAQWTHAFSNDQVSKLRRR